MSKETVRQMGYSADEPWVNVLGLRVVDTADLTIWRPVGKRPSGRVIALRAFLLLALGCGSQTPVSSTNPEPVVVEPAQPMTEPTAESPSDPAPESGPVVQYAIDGEPVDESTFNELFERLDVDEEPYEGETVVNPDGSYGGAGETFHAREGNVSYRYESHTYPLDDGRVGESRLLFRE